MDTDIIACFLIGLRMIMVHVGFSFTAFVIIGVNTEDDGTTAINDIVTWLFVNGVIEIVMVLSMFLILIIMCITLTNKYIVTIFVNINLMYSIAILVIDIVIFISIFKDFELCRYKGIMFALLFAQFITCYTNIKYMDNPSFIHILKTTNDIF